MRSRSLKFASNWSRWRFSLAAKRATEQDVAVLNELNEKTKLEAKAEDLEGFFESHLSFRKKVWELSGNRYVQQALERVVIPLYALYLIRRPYNREGILQTVFECIEHQDESSTRFDVMTRKPRGKSLATSWCE